MAIKDNSGDISFSQRDDIARQILISLLNQSINGLCRETTDIIHQFLIDGVKVAYEAADIYILESLKIK